MCLQDKQPPPLDKTVTDKVLVEVDIDITRILLIDEVDGIFETQQFVNLSWKDPRIQFHNLKQENFQNSLLESEKGMIWVPTVTFLNTARQERSQRDNTSLITVERLSGYTISDDTEPNNVYIYQVGSETLQIQLSNKRLSGTRKYFEDLSSIFY